MQELLNQLLVLVSSGQLDSRHAAEIMRLAKKEIFGDYFYGIAMQFVNSGQFQEMGLLSTQTTPQSHEILVIKLTITKALIAGLVSKKKEFYDSIGE